MYAAAVMALAALQRYFAAIMKFQILVVSCPSFDQGLLIQCMLSLYEDSYKRSNYGIKNL
jgi:hypothetical protein